MLLLGSPEPYFGGGVHERIFLFPRGKFKLQRYSKNVLRGLCKIPESVRCKSNPKMKEGELKKWSCNVVAPVCGLVAGVHECCARRQYHIDPTYTTVPITPICDQLFNTRLPYGLCFSGYLLCVLAVMRNATFNSEICK